MVLQVRIERVARGLRSYQFAQLIGCNPQLWMRYELGTQKPPPAVVERVSQLLGKTPGALFAPVEVNPIDISNLPSIKA